MRTYMGLRAVSGGALGIAIAVPAVALATGSSQAQSATVIHLDPRRLAYGGEETVTGISSTPGAGQRLALQFAPRASAAWSTIASTTTTASGAFRVRARLFRSGLVRVVSAPTASAASQVPFGAPSSTAAPSASQPVDVAARLMLAPSPSNVLEGGTIAIAGHLLPGLAWRPVVLQALRGNRWEQIARAFTRRGGRFELRFAADGLGTERLRVRFAGDRANAGALGRLGTLTVYRESVASWYDDGGATACGFHAGMGVANRTLPCGTRVTFLYAGRQVTAVVDDRGPFVAGRDWDLNQNTAAALGMGGVATVWSSA